jgi:putative ABC transport system substrate-binding protein
MDRRTFLAGTGAVLLVASLAAEAQQGSKVWRLGVLSPGLSPSGASARFDAFRRGLRELGYIEGQNIAIEWRFAEGKDDQLRDLAAELVRLKVDVVLTINTPATRAAKNATTTIPIVFTAVADSAAAKVVASLARPGGNLTGLTTLVAETSGKRLELLKEALPKVSRAAVLWNSSSEGAGFVFEH